MASDESTPASTEQHPPGSAEKGRTAGQPPATPGPGAASAGIPSGGAPSGATNPGTVPEDASDETAPSPGGPQYGEQSSRVLPGQPPGPVVPPVPAPGAVGVTAPAVQTSQAASPEDGIHRAEKEADSDASISSPGSWTSLAVPGKPDGEVDTRSR
jgi:hypothetical protein